MHQYNRRQQQGQEKHPYPNGVTDVPHSLTAAIPNAAAFSDKQPRERHWYLDQEQAG
jgi:hypothetical protein